MALDPNKVVTINFTLTDDEGHILDTTANNESFAFMTGVNMVLPKLEEAVGGMLIGTKKNLKLNAVDGYGMYNEDAVQVVGKENFPEDFVLEAGMEYMARNPDGVDMPFVITNVAGEDVTIDFNHPLAGVNLNFDIELVDIRDATAEELSHGHVHGAGGHHH